MNKKHIVIIGERHVGKTSLINRLMEDCTVPIYGFRTKSAGLREDGFHSIYMHPADMSDNACTEDNRIGDCNGRSRQVKLDVFNELGVKLLEAESDGIILMDELGFMEEEAHAFCNKVLELFEGDIPIIATAKAGHKGRFLDDVRNNVNADAYYIDENNRDELYYILRERLKPIISKH